MPKSKKYKRSVPPITPAQFIRQHVLRMQTEEIAEALGVSASIVSRYEVFPKKHHNRIVSLGVARGVKIKPSWFEQVPWGVGVPN